MTDWERHPHIEVDYQAGDEEHAPRTERQYRRMLDNDAWYAWENHQETWEEQNEYVGPEPAGSERMQMELDFEKAA